MNEGPLAPGGPVVPKRPVLRTGLLRILRSEYLWLILIVAATLAAHFSFITLPKEYVFDEAHYIKDAKYIMQNRQTERPEHPPLAKLMILAGVKYIGDDPWGWRIPSIVMGTIGIILFFFICRKLNLGPFGATFAAFLFGFENLSFIQASIAMLDVFMLTLILAVFLLYLYRQYILSGLFLGLAALAKIVAALAGPVIFFHWAFSRPKRSWWFWTAAFFAPLSYLAFMPLFDFIITGKFQNPASRTKEMLGLMGSLTFSTVQHDALSRPWEWILNYIPAAYWYTPHYTGAISLTLWVVMIPVVLYMLYRAVRGNDGALFGFCWFAGLYVLWVPLSILTNRVSFIFYFYPAVGSVCLGAGMGLSEILQRAVKAAWRIRVPAYAAVGLFLLLHLGVFLVLTPVIFRT